MSETSPTLGWKLQVTALCNLPECFTAQLRSLKLVFNSFPTQMNLSLCFETEGSCGSLSAEAVSVVESSQGKKPYTFVFPFLKWI